MDNSGNRRNVGDFKSQESKHQLYDSLLYSHEEQNDGDEFLEIQTPSMQENMMDSRTTKAIQELTKAEDSLHVFDKIIAHGWIHKQGQRVFKGPVAKSWRKRYFALEGSKMYYFNDPVDCRKYFTSRSTDLVVGVIDLRDAFRLKQSERLDLPGRGIEVHTRQRVWLLCPETDSEFKMFFDALEATIIIEGSGNVLKRDLPNVRVYEMKGRGAFRLFYVLFIITSIMELGGLLFWFPVGIKPCDQAQPQETCAEIQLRTLDSISCGPEPFNGYFSPPKLYMEFAGVDNVPCFYNAKAGQWISYLLFTSAEFISIVLGSLYFLGMWKPVRRGCKNLSEFSPEFPKSQWPTVDVLLCHYSEPCEDTMATLEKIMEMDYPPHLLHVWICDDGYCKSKWKPGAKVPEISVNRGIIENAGDVRHSVAQFMYDKVCTTDDIEVNEWRKEHTSVNIPTDANPRVVRRNDCAVGSVRDDYKYPGYFHVTFVGRIKPSVHHSKAGNINNVLYNEGAKGRYAMILDNDMKPHKMFVQATLPFFFDSGFARTYRCQAHGCGRIAKLSCASCKVSGVPEERISYCSKDCYQMANHVNSSLHKRQVTRNAHKENIRCNACSRKIGNKGYCKKCEKHLQTAANQVSRRNETILEIQGGDEEIHYSDNVRFNQVGYVQTPQYFEDHIQLQLGDPCGHRNATFFDAAQTGMDGYECASFAGTNAMFRRDALDSVNGIQYGSLTEDAFTGKMMIDKGWKGLYFRKDFEGELEERIRLAEGAIPESVAASLAQRKRWAKGNFQIFLRKKKDLVDPEWERPRVELPPPRKVNRFMKFVFFINLTVYPIGSFPAIFFFYVTIYFLYTGEAPIFTSGLRLLIALVPKMVVQSVLSALSNRSVDNNDVMRSQQTWFSYAFVHVLAVFEAFYWKITGKEASWANTGALGGNSPMEVPNLLVFLATAVGVLWSVVRYFTGYDATSTTHDTPLVFASVFLGLFTASQLAPMVRMSIQEYFGWSHRSLTDQGNLAGSLTLALVLMIVCIWIFVEQPNSSVF